MLVTRVIAEQVMNHVKMDYEATRGNSIQSLRMKSDVPADARYKFNFFSKQQTCELKSILGNAYHDAGCGTYTCCLGKCAEMIRKEQQDQRLESEQHETIACLLGL